MQTTFQFRGGNCLISVSGRITIDSSPDLRVLLLRPLEAMDCKSLTVDLYDVAYVDTSALAVLLEVLREASLSKKVFHLTGLRGRPRFLLEATRLLNLFNEVARDAPQ